jgi:hypothetical protein
VLRVRFVALTLLALALAGCGGSGEPSVGGAPGEVVELTSLATLKAAFAADASKPRVLLLLSPT